MKKISIIVLLAVFLLTVLGEGVAFAATTPVPLGEGKTVIAATDHSLAIDPLKLESGYISFNAGKWMEYKVIAPSDGIYELSMLVGSTGNINVKVTVNSTTQKTGVLTTTGGYFVFAYRTAARVPLTAGENTVRVECVSGGCYVDKVGFEIASVPISNDGKTTIPSYEYMRANRAIAKEDIHLSFRPGDWVEYDLKAPRSGYYNISITYGAPQSVPMTMLVNETDGYTATLTGAADYMPVVTAFFARIQLKEGFNTIRLTNNQFSCYFDNVIIEPLKPVSVKTITIQDRKPKSDGTGDENPSHAIVTINSDGTSVVPRGYDTVVITFDQTPLASSVTEDTVKLSKSSGEAIDCQFNLKDAVLTLYLLKTMDYTSQYNITLEGIKDNYELFSMPRTTYGFTTGKTGSADKGAGSLAVNSSSLEGTQLSISGRLLSSKGVGISGRKIEVYMIDPSNNFIATPIASMLSGTNGSFSITYTMPDGSMSGRYSFLMAFEYSTADIYVNLVYVSAQTEAKILSDIAESTTAAQVETIFQTNETNLGITLSGDLAGLDKNKVYAYFVGKSLSTAKELIQQYQTAIVMEKINQATAVSAISAVISDKTSCRYLGLDDNVFGYIPVNKTALMNDIFALPVISNQQEMVSSINLLISKWLMIEYGKQELNAAAENKSVYVGQAVEIAIGFITKQSDIDKATYTLTVSDDAILKNASIQSSIKNTKLTKQGKTLVIELEADSALSNISSLATLVLPNTGETASYEASISGEVTYAVDIPYKVASPVKKSDFNIQVVKNTSPKVEKETSSSRSGGGGKAVSNPVVTPPVDDSPKEDSNPFIDIEHVGWAKEGISELVNRNILSVNEQKEFRPDNSVTREEFIKMLVIAFDLLDTKATTTLKDVDKNEWYYPYIASAQKHGLVTGDEKGNFNVGGNITREDMSVTIYRAVSKLGYSFEQDKNNLFADDSSISEYAKNAVYTMKIMKILSGVGNNEFAPKNNATRAMGAKVIFETLKAVGI